MFAQKLAIGPFAGENDATIWSALGPDTVGTLVLVFTTVTSPIRVRVCSKTIPFVSAIQADIPRPILKKVQYESHGWSVRLEALQCNRNTLYELTGQVIRLHKVQYESHGWSVRLETLQCNRNT